LRRRLVEAENKYNSIYNDSSSHLKNLEQVNDTLKRQLLESKSTITKYEVEMSRVSSSMETSLTNAGR
jgi:predicted RNase H-like nuclease (RuvC/YqgF family)